MSQADEILKSLAENVHEHYVADDDIMFIVNQITKEISNATENKIVLVQGDHKSEIFTFKMPRYIEGHDMAKCNLVYAVYINTETEGRDPKYKTGVRMIDNFRIGADGVSMTGSWLVTKNATSIKGILSFMLVFSCMDDKVITYRWGTNSFNKVYVLESKDGNLVFEDEYVDVIEQWKETVLADLEEYIKQQIEANADIVQIQTNKTNIENLRKTVDGNHTNLSNELKTQKALLDSMAKVPEGGTTGDLELVGLRVDFEGIEHDNAGEAFRDVSEKLYSGYKMKGSVNPDHTTFLSRGSNNLFSKRTCFTETWINASGFISMKDHFTSDFIPCCYGEIYSCTDPITFSELQLFDKDKVRLGSITINPGTTSFTISNKAARYFCLQSDTSIIDTLMINRGPELLDYEEWDGLFRLTVDVEDISKIFDARKYFYISPNLFNRNDLQLNTWYNLQKGFIQLSNYFATQYIPIEVGSYIFSTRKLPTSPGAVEIHIFDENYNRLKIVELKDLCGPTQYDYVLDIEYDDYKYMIFQMSMGFIDVGFVINRGTELHDYEAGGEYLLPEYIDLDSIATLFADKYGLYDYDMVIPNHIYLRNNGRKEQYNLYFNGIFRGNNPPVIDVVCNYGKQLEECWRYETNSTGYSQANGDFDLTINGYDADMNLLVSKTITVTVINTSSANPINYLAIGDSITSQAHYVKYLTEKMPNLTAIGTMAAINEDHYREGRSGWSLNNYLNNIGLDAYSNEFRVDSPFLYPVDLDAAKYKGNVSQIKAIIEGKGTYILPYLRKQCMENGKYIYNSNGYLNNPEVGDYMCDPSLTNPWVVWDGYAWSPMMKQPTDFEFSFSKYMERYSYMFNGLTPTHVSICLGANDFQQNNPTETDIENWYTKLLTLIESIKLYNPNIVILLAVPPLGADQDAWGKQLNSGATAYNYYRNLKLLEKVLIEKHDEDDNIYVVPMTEMLDVEDAYDFDNEKRNIYSDTIVTRQNNWVHPNAKVGHNQMSDAMLGILAKTR